MARKKKVEAETPVIREKGGDTAPENGDVVANLPFSGEIVLDEWTPEMEAMVNESPEMLKALQALTVRAKDSPESFFCFYDLVHNRYPPDHVQKWVVEAYKAREEGRGTVVEAFRGSTKTTAMTITFTAYRIGKNPERANLLIQVGDDIAADNTAQVADIIANSAGWKVCFPHVVPDRERGWGAGGYEVKRDDLDYGAWRALNSNRKDPTLVGVGYKSREIIGKHPDGMLVVDDIHDENNTASERELSTVRKILMGTVFPTMTEKTWTVFIGTPWVPGDCLNYVASTGEFAHVRTPVYAEVDGEKVLAWPGRFTLEEIEKARVMSSVEFARMYLLDLTATQNRVFKYQEFPSSQVRYGWPVVGGCDYASSGNYRKLAEGKGDYFAVAYVAKLPGGGAVVLDGVLDRCTQAQAEMYLVRAQELFTNYIGCAVESVGKGDDFIQTVRRNPGLRIIPQHSGRRSKEARLEMELSPWLENGTIKICDAETPFLNELRRELNEYPNHTHDDAMDAVYYALRLMPDVLKMEPVLGMEELPGLTRKKKQMHPAFAFARR